MIENLSLAIRKTKQVQSYHFFIFMLIGSKIIFYALTTYLRDVTFISLKRYDVMMASSGPSHLLLSIKCLISLTLELYVYTLSLTWIPSSWCYSKTLIHDFNICNVDSCKVILQTRPMCGYIGRCNNQAQSSLGSLYFIWKEKHNLKR